MSVQIIILSSICPRHKKAWTNLLIDDCGLKDFNSFGLHHFRVKCISLQRGLDILMTETFHNGLGIYPVFSQNGMEKDNTSAGGGVPLPVTELSWFG